MTAYVECVEPYADETWCTHDSCIEKKSVLMGTTPVAETERKNALSAALERVDVYASSDGLDATCDCGAELTGFRGPFPKDDATYNQSLLTLVERALEHRKTCKKA